MVFSRKFRIFYSIIELTTLLAYSIAQGVVVEVETSSFIGTINTTPFESTTEPIILIKEDTSAPKIENLVPICAAVKCDFSKDLCSYMNHPNGIPWERSNEKLTIQYVDQLNNMITEFSNSFMSILKSICPKEWCHVDLVKDTGYFLKAFPKSNSSDQVAVLSSAKFSQESLLSKNKAKKITFKYFRPAQGQKLKICFETPQSKFTIDSALKTFVDSCPDLVPNWSIFTMFMWNTLSVNLPTDANRVHFVAYTEKVQPLVNFAMGLDEISLSDC